MKKGFTLIELLAVILILGIIALIAIPTVNNILQESRRGAFRETNNQIASAIEKNCQLEQLKNKTITQKYYINDKKLSTDVGIKGSLPDIGLIEVDQNCNVKLQTSDQNFCAIKGYNDTTILVNDESCQIEDGELLTDYIRNTYDVHTVGSSTYMTGLQPNNWVKIGNRLFRIIRMDSEGVRILYDSNCTNTSDYSTCALDSQFQAEYANFAQTDYNTDVLNNINWENDANVTDDMLQNWYDSLNIDSKLTTSINWCNSILLGSQAFYYGPTCPSNHGCDDEPTTSDSIEEVINKLQTSECSAKTAEETGKFDVTGKTANKTPWGLVNPSDLVASNYLSQVANNYDQLSEEYSYLTLDLLTFNPSSVSMYYGSSHNIVTGPYYFWSGTQYNTRHVGLDITNNYYDSSYKEFGTIRPVLNLRANIFRVSGTGTQSDPFVIK